MNFTKRQEAQMVVSLHAPNVRVRRRLIETTASAVTTLITRRKRANALFAGKIFLCTKQMRLADQLCIVLKNALDWQGMARVIKLALASTAVKSSWLTSGE
jgi:hypothetical protein